MRNFKKKIGGGGGRGYSIPNFLDSLVHQEDIKSLFTPKFAPWGCFGGRVESLKMQIFHQTKEQPSDVVSSYITSSSTLIAMSI
jgi:hypothetical protein